MAFLSLYILNFFGSYLGLEAGYPAEISNRFPEYLQKNPGIIS
jgi:hypothetical protein